MTNETVTYGTESDIYGTQSDKWDKKWHIEHNLTKRLQNVIIGKANDKCNNKLTFALKTENNQLLTVRLLRSMLNIQLPIHGVWARKQFRQLFIWRETTKLACELAPEFNTRVDGYKGISYSERENIWERQKEIPRNIVGWVRKEDRKEL